jgi:hypothetical protein
VKKLSSLNAKERAAKAAKLAGSLDKKRRDNLGSRTKEIVASSTAKAAAKKQDLPEEAEEGVRGYAWTKKHGKKPY